MGSFNPPVTAFLSADEKQEWAAKGYPFMIIDCRLVDSKYGPAYNYKLSRYDSKTGEIVEVKQLSLSVNTRRTEEAEWIQHELLEDSAGVGPVKLGMVDTEQGNPAWIFEGVE
jgi:hypothetical protein